MDSDSDTDIPRATNHADGVDVVVFGGGVAGLWLINRLVAEGYNAILLEANALGAGQTRYAQGIIHGGTKYALTGTISAAADAVAAMPAIWRASLHGEGDIDLMRTRILTENQLMWSTTSLTSRMAGFFASKLMRSRTDPISEPERPELFRHPDFHGQVYRLEEPVLDTASMTRALAAAVSERLLKIDWPDGVTLQRDENGYQIRLIRDGEALEIHTRAIVLTAGRGNEELLNALGQEKPKMQLRPLQMVMVRGDSLSRDIYAHCLGASPNPRITISSHEDRNGQIVWYLGGDLAEEGVNRTPDEQIAAAQSELAKLLPWLDQGGLAWSTVTIERAEPRQGSGKRPDGAFAEYHRGVITAWPTKLALAPKLTEQVFSLLREADILPDDSGPLDPAIAQWGHPDFAPLPWDEEHRWS